MFLSITNAIIFLLNGTRFILLFIIISNIKYNKKYFQDDFVIAYLTNRIVFINFFSLKI